MMDILAREPVVGHLVQLRAALGGGVQVQEGLDPEVCTLSMTVAHSKLGKNYKFVISIKNV